MIRHVRQRAPEAPRCAFPCPSAALPSILAPLLTLALTLAPAALAPTPAAAQAATSAAPAAPAPAAMPVGVARAQAREVVRTVTVSGTLAPREEAQVFARIAGQDVTEILAEEGDVVDEGDVLARLQDATLRAELAQAEANLAAARAGVEQAEAQLASAEASARQASLALDRTLQLRERGDTAQATLDQAQAAADQAEAGVGAARAGEATSRAAVAQAEAALDIASTNLARATVTAPVAGRILTRGARLGALSGTGAPLFTIAVDGDVELDAEVVETDLAPMSVGDPAIVAPAGLPPRPGTVRLISPQVDAATRLGRARIGIEDAASGALRPGSFASAIVTLDRHRALTLPASAVLSEGGEDYVQLVRDGRVERRAVRTGELYEGQREILAGLEEGDAVVARAGAFLRDGDRVAPVAEPAPVLADAPGTAASR